MITDDYGDITEVKQEVTNEQIAARLDALGLQMNWVVENLQGLFQFVQQVGQNGGGIKGMMALLKAGPPKLGVQNDE